MYSTLEGGSVFLWDYCTCHSPPAMNTDLNAFWVYLWKYTLSTASYLSVGSPCSGMAIRRSQSFTVWILLGSFDSAPKNRSKVLMGSGSWGQRARIVNTCEVCNNSFDHLRLDCMINVHIQYITNTTHIPHMLLALVIRFENGQSNCTAIAIFACCEYQVAHARMHRVL